MLPYPQMLPYMAAPWILWVISQFSMGENVTEELRHISTAAPAVVSSALPGSHHLLAVLRGKNKTAHPKVANPLAERSRVQ